MCMYACMHVYVRECAHVIPHRHASKLEGGHGLGW